MEDDDRAADLVLTTLRREGFETLRTATAEEGLVRAAKRKPDLITLDIFLPAMDGWAFLERLKGDPRLADIPVVIISAAPDLDRSRVLGARKVLPKPFTHAELIEALAGLIDLRPRQDPPRLLVVDDNAKAVELLAVTLESEGYLVQCAYGGAEAIQAAQDAPPDLVILDLIMPEVTGFEVARVLRQAQATARIPILVLTAKNLSAEDRAQLDGQVNQILDKAHFIGTDLLAEVRRALPNHGRDGEKIHG